MSNEPSLFMRIRRERIIEQGSWSICETHTTFSSRFGVYHEHHGMLFVAVRTISGAPGICSFYGCEKQAPPELIGYLSLLRSTIPDEEYQ